MNTNESRVAFIWANLGSEYPGAPHFDSFQYDLNEVSKTFLFHICNVLTGRKFASPDKGTGFVRYKSQF